MGISYYDILDIKSEASTEEIRDAYVKTAKLYHPDATNIKDPEYAKNMFIMVKKAFDVLGNPESRKLYDEQLNSNKFKLYQGNNNGTSNDDSYKNEENQKQEKSINKKKNNKIIIGIVCFLIFAIALGIIGLNIHKSNIKKQEEARQKQEVLSYLNFVNDILKTQKGIKRSVLDAVESSFFIKHTSEKYEYYESQFRTNVIERVNRYEIKNEDIQKTNSLLLELVNSTGSRINDVKLSKNDWEKITSITSLGSISSKYYEILQTNIDELCSKYKIDFILGVE